MQDNNIEGLGEKRALLVIDDFTGNKKSLKNVRANINISILTVTSTGPSRKKMKSDWPPPEALFALL